MSSHHFVREDQEPALLLLDAELLPFSAVQELLEWSPTVMVSYQVLPKVMGWGIKIDLVIAPEAEKEKLFTDLSDHGPLQWIWQQPGESVPILAWLFLLASRQRYVNMVGAVDAHILQQVLDWSDRLHITCFDGVRRWNWISSQRWEKWLPAGTTYEIHAEGQETQKFLCERDELQIVSQPYAFWVVEYL